MKWALGYFINRFLNGRELVIWDTGTFASECMPLIREYALVSFFISRDAAREPVFMGKPVLTKDEAGLCPQKHYVIVLSGKKWTDIRDSLLLAGFEPNTDYMDFGMGGAASIDVNCSGVFIGRGSHMPFSEKEIGMFIRSIGRFTSIANNVSIQNNHHMNMITTSYLYGALSEENRRLIRRASDSDKLGTGLKLSIGNDVWIGANVFINSSSVSSIGDGAVIGSGSVVTHDVPPYAVAYGIPAKIQRYRFAPEQIDILLRVKWWEWDDETINKNAEMLVYPDKFFEAFGGGHES